MTLKEARRKSNDIKRHNARAEAGLKIYIAGPNHSEHLYFWQEDYDEMIEFGRRWVGGCPDLPRIYWRPTYTVAIYWWHDEMGFWKYDRTMEGQRLPGGRR